MKLEAGKVLRISEENPLIRGCTVSRQIHQNDGPSLFIFSLAEKTDISAECYGYHKWLTVYDGEMAVLTPLGECLLRKGDSFLTPKDVPVGMKTQNGCIYTEIGFGKDDTMNEVLKAGEAFALSNLLPYQDGKIVNMDLVHNDTMKFVVMSFDAGTGLSEHAAPGEALVFALDGEAIIGYEGKEYTLKAGETFKFDKMGRHSVKAVNRFKMALLLVLD